MQENNHVIPYTHEDAEKNTAFVVVFLKSDLSDDFIKVAIGAIDMLLNLYDDEVKQNCRYSVVFQIGVHTGTALLNGSPIARLVQVTRD